MLLVPRSIKNKLNEDKLSSFFKKPRKRDSVSSNEQSLFNFSFANSDTPNSSSSRRPSIFRRASVALTDRSGPSGAPTRRRSDGPSGVFSRATSLSGDADSSEMVDENYSYTAAPLQPEDIQITISNASDHDMTPVGKAPARLGEDPNSRYTSFTSECISLSNSEMTSNFEIDSVVEPEEDLANEEDLNDYKVGGYHPVKLGDIYNSGLTQNNYKIIKKLGWGHFSTVWLCKCIESQEFFAIKIVKSSDVYCDSALDEIKILNHLKHPGNDHLINLRDSFFIDGINGNHVCLVFDLLGESLLNYLKDYQKHKKSSSFFGKLTLKEEYGGLPISMVKSVTTQILQSLAYTHKKGIIHTDLKPENVLISSSSEQIDEDLAHSSSIIKPSKPLKASLNDKNLKVTLSDFGNATFVDHHFTNSIQTRQYRSPEVILKYKTWGASADIWSLGCIVFELITGDFLFDPHDGGHDFTKDEDHIAQIIELLGYFPKNEYLDQCKYFDHFFVKKHGQPEMRRIKNLKYWKLENVLIEKYKFKNDSNVHLLADFILKCLTFGLEDRYDASSLLKHPWLNSTAGYTPTNLPNLNFAVPGFTAEQAPTC